MTNREIVSKVRSTHKLFSDATLNDRSILAELRSNAIMLINQRTNQRKLWNTDTIFTTLSCVEMIQVDMATCCGYHSGRMVSRSKLKLPSIAEGNYQYLIQGVYDVAGTTSLKYSSLNRYINTLKLNLLTNENFYWIHNNYLFISSPHVKLAKIIFVPDGDISYELLYPECECEGKREKPCTSRLDEDFRCPGALITPLVTMTSQSLLSTYFRIPKDHTADNKDAQVNKI